MRGEEIYARHVPMSAALNPLMHFLRHLDLHRTEHQNTRACTLLAQVENRCGAVCRSTRKVSLEAEPNARTGKPHGDFVQM